MYYYLRMKLSSPLAFFELPNALIASHLITVSLYESWLMPGKLFILDYSRNPFPSRFTFKSQQKFYLKIVEKIVKKSASIDK